MNRRTAAVAAGAVFSLVVGTGTAVALASGAAGGDPRVEHPAGTNLPTSSTEKDGSTADVVATTEAAFDLATEPTEATEPTTAEPATTPATETDGETGSDDDSTSKTTAETEHDSDSEDTPTIGAPRAPTTGSSEPSGDQRAPDPSGSHEGPGSGD
jgi:hypothetical protein